MKCSGKGIQLITEFEGLRLKAYRAVPTEQFLTIGYGHYGPDVKAGMVITKEQAVKYLEEDVEAAERSVDNWNGIYHWSQNEFDALVSFTYNCGAKNLKTLLANGTRSKSVIANKILLYTKSGGKTLKGLVRRREAERKMFVGD